MDKALAAIFIILIYTASPGHWPGLAPAAALALWVAAFYKENMPLAFMNKALAAIESISFAMKLPSRWRALGLVLLGTVAATLVSA